MWIRLQPQNSMPDVVIWMMSGEKRIAYHRIPAYDLLYSPHEAARGKCCGQVLDRFMQVTHGSHANFLRLAILFSLRKGRITVL